MVQIQMVMEMLPLRPQIHNTLAKKAAQTSLWSGLLKMQKKEVIIIFICHMK